jgi:hypothetical protein
MAFGGTGLNYEISAHGFDAAIARLGGVAERAEAWQVVAPKIFDTLEEGEARIFVRLHGRMVKSGDLRASLTERSAPGAVRRVGHEDIEFGTSVWYARAAASRAKLRILRTTPKARREIKALVGAYVTHGSGV